MPTSGTVRREDDGAVAVLTHAYRSAGAPHAMSMTMLGRASDPALAARCRSGRARDRAHRRRRCNFSARAATSSGRKADAHRAASAASAQRSPSHLVEGETSPSCGRRRLRGRAGLSLVPPATSAHVAARTRQLRLLVQQHRLGSCRISGVVDGCPTRRATGRAQHAWRRHLRRPRRRALGLVETQTGRELSRRERLCAATSRTTPRSLQRLRKARLARMPTSLER
jgi:hypothetical protein